MKTVTLSISSCTKCPFFMISNSYSTDGYDMVEDWFCNKSNKHISKCVEWHDKVEIPDWCPLDSSTSVKPKSLKDLTPEECVHIAKIIEPSKNWILTNQGNNCNRFHLIQEDVFFTETSDIHIDYENNEFRYYDYDEGLMEYIITGDKLKEITEYLKQINKNG